MRDAPLYCIRIGYLTCKHDAILSVYTTPPYEVHILRPLLLWSDCIGQQGKQISHILRSRFLISPMAQTITIPPLRSVDYYYAMLRSFPPVYTAIAVS